MADSGSTSARCCTKKAQEKKSGVDRLGQVTDRPPNIAGDLRNQRRMLLSWIYACTVKAVAKAAPCEHISTTHIVDFILVAKNFGRQHAPLDAKVESGGNSHFSCSFLLISWVNHFRMSRFSR